MLITGGCTLAGCGGFDEGGPVSSSIRPGPLFRPGPQMLSARAGGTATALPDGRALLTATLLADGRVLLAGGNGSNEDDLDSREYFDPDTGRFSPGLRLRDVYDPDSDTISQVVEPSTPRRSFVTASVLGPDVVLVAGGYDDGITPTAAARVVRLAP